jgi:O-antigen/teichoic acid export membrane protein
MVLPELAPIFLRQEAYLEGLQIVPLLLGGGLFLGIYYNLSLWYKLTDKTWYGAVISMAGAFVTLILNIILIPKMGYMGSAWATLVTYLSMTLISFFWGRRHYLVPYRLLPICFYLIAAGGTIYLFQEMESILFRYLTGFAGLLILMLITLIFERKYLLSSSKN